MNRRLTGCLILLLAAIIAISGCSKNLVEKPSTDGLQLKSGPTTVFTVNEVPAWVLYPPRGEYAIGIVSPKEKDLAARNAAAAKNAAVALSQNLGSFFFDIEQMDKLLAADPEEPFPDKAGAGVNPDSKAYFRLIKELKPLAETEFHGYRLILMGTADTAVSQDVVSVSAGLLPRWGLAPSAYPDGDYVYASGRGVDPDLQAAWLQAQDEALNKLAQYRMKQVVEAMRSTGEEEERQLILSRATANLQASFQGHFLYHVQMDSAHKFNVHILLNMPGRF